MNVQRNLVMNAIKMRIAQIHKDPIPVIVTADTMGMAKHALVNIDYNYLLQ